MDGKTFERTTDDLAESTPSDSGVSLSPDMTLPPVTDKTDGFVDDTQDSTYKAPDSYRGTLDEKGKEFDPSLHRYPPELTATGRWRKLPKNEQRRAPDEQLDTNNAAYLREGEKMARLYADLHQIPFGPDGGLLDKSDLLQMRDAWAAKYAEDGLQQMAPIWQIILSSGLYTLGVVQRPTIWERVRAWYLITFKGKKPDARSNSREHDERQNQAGATSGE